MIISTNLLDADTVVEFRRQIAKLDLVDGTASARGGAKLVKQNRQSRPSDPAAAAIHRALEERILGHERIERHIIPKAIVGSRINHYGIEGRYGLHIDRAIMDGHRTDMSFTLFLSDPTEYDGGELHLADGATSPRFKLPAGHVVLYPTGLLHEVTPVTRGERWAFVGWIESCIAEPELRDAIAKVRSLEATLGDHPLGAIARLQLAEVEQSLLRIGSR